MTGIESFIPGLRGAIMPGLRGAIMPGLGGAVMPGPRCCHARAEELSCQGRGAVMPGLGSCHARAGSCHAGLDPVSNIT